MPTSLAQAATSSRRVLFVLSLAGLSKQETARRGNVAGMVGMALALVADHRARRSRHSERPVAVTAALILSCCSWAPPSARGRRAGSR